MRGFVVEEEQRYPIPPVPAPRQNVRSRFNPQKRKMIERYHAFRDLVRVLKVDIPDSCCLRFEMPVPKSGRHRVGFPHQQRPDLDNLVKGLLDAVFSEDAQVHRILAEKVWAMKGAIVVGRLREMEGEEK